MAVKIPSATVIGIEAIGVDVEIDISRGLPAFNIVGLPDTTVKEAKERIRVAIKNSGFDFPNGRITVNLAPAEVKKEGSLFDLPIAIGILVHRGIVDFKDVEDVLVLGELALDGSVRRVRGVLPVAWKMREWNLKRLIIPLENLYEVLLVKKNFEDLEIYPVTSLVEAINAIKGWEEPTKTSLDVISIDQRFEIDFVDVEGQLAAKRAVEIAVSGGHNILLFGPPGTGKTMIAMRIPTIMPEMELNEIVETTAIYSVAGELKEGEIIAKRPFRNPHHTISDVALLGGGTHFRPGEVSLANNGVLFLDELPEFRRNVIEALRQPLETGYISIGRVGYRVTLPAKFMLVTAMNPCPCGYLGHPTKECKCTPLEIKKYTNKVSGPILDRIDMTVEVAQEKKPVYKTSIIQGDRFTSKDMRSRVIEAREIQRRRFSDREYKYNSRIPPKDVKHFCKLSHEAEEVFDRAVKSLSLSMRGVHRTLKVARTIADLDHSNFIERQHILEALQYRGNLFN
ncbi:MAG: YifB family Mg chelatase-like AAA ATPase [Thermosulfidibacteraceae bacterium]